MMMRQTSNSVASNGRPQNRTLLMDALESRTLFSVAMLPPEMLADASGGATDELTPQHERMAPPENNHQATMSDSRPEFDVTEIADLPGQQQRLPQVGDLDDNGVVDQSDINAMQVAIQGGRYSFDADLNGDRVVDAADRDMLIRDVLGTEYGDLNLDGRVDLVDWEVLNKALYFRDVDGWEHGDFNGDGLATPADWRIWNRYKDLSRPQPEPPTFEETPQPESPGETVDNNPQGDPTDRPFDANSMSGDESHDTNSTGEPTDTIRPRRMTEALEARSESVVPQAVSRLDLDRSSAVAAQRATTTDDVEDNVTLTEQASVTQLSIATRVDFRPTKVEPAGPSAQHAVNSFSRRS